MELAFGLVLLAYILSDVLFRFMGLGAVSNGSRREAKIAFTFDDGPSEQTENILKVLRKYGIKATFFLTGEKAKRKPELVKAIEREGHQIEDHGKWHSPWKILIPWLEWIHISEGPGRFYRPPHGIQTPFTRFFTFISRKQVVLWDLESKDWTDMPLDQMSQRLLYYLRPGSIVLLHDGPKSTLELLESTLPTILELGYQPVRLDALDIKPLRPRLALVRALQGFNEAYDRKHTLIRAQLGPFDFIKFEKKTFPFGPWKGKTAVELHIDSERVVELSPFEVLRFARKNLKDLAQKLSLEEKPPEIIFAFSYQAEALRVLGFKHFPWPLPPLQRGIAALATIWQLWLYRGEFPHLDRRASASLMYLSGEDFLKRFPPSTPASPSPAPGAGQSPPP